MLGKRAFSLPELIIVIVIITILFSIGFLSFRNYTKKTMDSVRISDITKLKKSLINYEAVFGKYPFPDNFIEASSGWKEGVFGDGVKEKIGNIDTFTDPKTKEFYKYMVNIDNTDFKLWAKLENKRKYIVSDIIE